MSYKLWTTNELLTSSDVNNHLMKQTVIVCTSGTRPASPPDGMVIFETDTKRYLTYNAATVAWEQFYTQGPWTNYTTVFTTAGGGGGAGTGATQHGAYKLYGKTCVAEGTFIFGTGATGGSGAFQISLPFTAATRTSANWLGPAYYRDVSAGSGGHFIGFCMVSSAATVMEFYAASGNQQVIAAAPFTFVVTDAIRWSVTYEIA